MDGYWRVADHLLSDHLGPNGNPEPGLLWMLYEAIPSSSGAGSAAGGSDRASAPLDLGALELWDEISGEIRSEPHDPTVFSEAEILSEVLVDTAVRGSVAMLKLYEKMLSWEAKIREKFDPPKRIPMRAVECPMCRTGKSREGEEPLELVASASPPYATCLVCGMRWHGGELLDLKKLIGEAL